jgi:hypothetical protein
MSAISYTLQGTDNLKYYRCTAHHTAGIVINIPDDIDVSIPINSEVTFRQCDGHLIFQADTGVVLNVPDNRDRSTDHVGAVVTVKKVAANDWDIFGSLTLLTV